MYFQFLDRAGLYKQRSRKEGYVFSYIVEFAREQSMMYNIYSLYNRELRNVGGKECVGKKTRGREVTN